ncbi:MAG: family 31 glucosidase [Treponema sp.]|nr:family 31 glucosidase [Treponema sp.]
MEFIEENGSLVIKNGSAKTILSPWGKDSIRVQHSEEYNFDKSLWALEEEVKNSGSKIEITEIEVSEPWHVHYENPESHVQKVKTASLTNGKLTARVNFEGWISFWDGEKELFSEAWQNRWRIDRYCAPLNTAGRELKANPLTGDFKATARFEAYDDEVIYGMGQYQDSHLNKKGCVLELAHRNSQASVPFFVSSRGYGFLWNNPAIGTASFGKNGTTWTAERTRKIDYWVTCGSPSEIHENYTAVTGRTPMMEDFAMGFWQCKLRYQNQDEVLNVAREYKKRGLPLDVIVIDFFHWTIQGDFKFDPEDWPDPEKMVKELGELGVKVMVSVWPTIDERSENFEHMAREGLLIGFDKGKGFNMDWMGNTVFYDTTNPAAQKFVWEKCKENYFKKGINLFWLDEAEPEYGIYDFEKYSYFAGPAMTVSNIYPKTYAKGFYDGLVSEGVKNPLSLVRCAWAGSQKYGTVVWSGDIHSDFRSLRDQIQAGLSMNMAGIPWWTTDIGGFLGGDIYDESFRQLIVRWFAWGVFCPVMRLHGERPPFKAPEKPYHTVRSYQVKQMESGQDNEIWSFGDEAYNLMVPLLKLRESLKPYISSLMKAAHEKGEPVMRPLWFDFSNDNETLKIEDQYMFGKELLVAPVYEENVSCRKVYLPVRNDNKLWIEAVTGKEYKGGQYVEAEAPLGKIPVFYANGSNAGETVRKAF